MKIKETLYSPNIHKIFDKNIIINTGKSMNWDEDILYSINTFTDKWFFDEDLFMKLSPSPDESWELRFNIIENKTCQSSIIYDYSKDTIIDLQSTILYNVVVDKKFYNLILN